MSLLFEPTTRALALRLRFGLGLEDRKGIKHPTSKCMALLKHPISKYVAFKNALICEVDK